MVLPWSSIVVTPLNLLVMSNSSHFDINNRLSSSQTQTLILQSVKAELTSPQGVVTLICETQLVALNFMNFTPIVSV